MSTSAISVDLGQGSALTLSTHAAQKLFAKLRKHLEPSGQSEPLEVLPEAHPMWDHHSGGDRHSRPQWAVEDLDEARVTLRGLSPKTRVFFDIVLSEPGRLFTSTEIIDREPDVFASPSAVAGALLGFTRHADRAGRPLPFYWWEGSPTRYAVRPSIAEVFLRARQS